MAMRILKIVGNILEACRIMILPSAEAIHSAGGNHLKSHYHSCSVALNILDLCNFQCLSEPGAMLGGARFMEACAKRHPAGQHRLDGLYQ